MATDTNMINADSFNKLINLIFDTSIDKDSLQHQAFQLTLEQNPKSLSKIVVTKSTKNQIKQLFLADYKDDLVILLKALDNNSELIKYIKSDQELIDSYFTKIAATTSTNVCEALIEKEIDLSFLHHFPMRYTAKNGNLPMLQLLVNKDNIDDYNLVHGRQSALDYAIEKGQLQVVEYLLQIGASTKTLSYFSQKQQALPEIAALLSKYAVPQEHKSTNSSTEQAITVSDPFGFDQIIVLPPPREDFGGDLDKKIVFFRSVSADIQETAIVKKGVYSQSFANIDQVLMREYVDGLRAAKSTLTVTYGNDLLTVNQQLRQS